MNITIREPGSALTHFIAMLLARGAVYTPVGRADDRRGGKGRRAL